MLSVIIVIQWRQSWWICWCERWVKFVYPSHCSGRTTRPNWTGRVASLMVALIRMVMVMVVLIEWWWWWSCRYIVEMNASNRNRRKQWSSCLHIIYFEARIEILDFRRQENHLRGLRSCWARREGGGALLSGRRTKIFFCEKMIFFCEKNIFLLNEDIFSCENRDIHICFLLHSRYLWKIAAN